MTSELKPCPFCGSSNTSKIIDDYNAFVGYCGDCEAQGPRKIGDNYNKKDAAAMASWNTRADHIPDVGKKVEIDPKHLAAALSPDDFIEKQKAKFLKIQENFIRSMQEDGVLISGYCEEEESNGLATENSRLKELLRWCYEVPNIQFNTIMSPTDKMARWKMIMPDCPEKEEIEQIIQQLTNDSGTMTE